jgi:hypothetical protein
MRKVGYNKFASQEQIFLDWVEVDYVALGEVAGLFSISNYPRPTEKEYLEVLEFIRYLLGKYGNRLKYYIGPGVRHIQKEPEEFIAWLKEIWYTGKYKDENMNFSIWFDLEPLEPEEEN